MVIVCKSIDVDETQCMDLIIFQHLLSECNYCSYLYYVKQILLMCKVIILTFDVYQCILYQIPPPSSNTPPLTMYFLKIFSLAALAGKCTVLLVHNFQTKKYFSQSTIMSKVIKLNRKYHLSNTGLTITFDEGRKIKNIIVFWLFECVVFLLFPFGISCVDKGIR